MILKCSLIAQSVKSVTAMQETWVRPLGWEDPLPKEMATHPGMLAWRIPWTEEPGRLLSMRLQESDTAERLSVHCVNFCGCCNQLPHSGWFKKKTTEIYPLTVLEEARSLK